MPSTKQIQAGDNLDCKMDGVRAKANALSRLPAEAGFCGKPKIQIPKTARIQKAFVSCGGWICGASKFASAG
jgi:hypothetical protein